VIFQLIKQLDQEHSVLKMCRVFGVSSSGYYDWKKRSKSLQEQRNEELTHVIHHVYKEAGGIFGSPKITNKLLEKGYSVAERTVQRIMKRDGLKSITSSAFKPHTTDSNHGLPVYPNLLNQNFQASTPGEVWMVDITYIPTQEGWLYLATVMDLFSRKIIGFNMSHRLTKDLAVTALNRALVNQTPQEGFIHHSDRGSQYASREYINILKAYGARISMSRTGNCYDNACVESFHGQIKKEHVYQQKYKTKEEAKISIYNYLVSFYNHYRTHSSLDYKTPNDYLRAYYSCSNSG